MINTNLTRKAMILAYNAHMGQVDKVGVPYIYHPIHLAEQMNDEYSCCVALLHDVVEDTDITIDELKNDFPGEVIDAIKLLTHDTEVPYMDYVKLIKENDLARIVKIADLTHNSDSTRLEKVTDIDRERMEKYKTALDYLNRE